MQTESTRTAHEGRNVKRIREILGIKQDALATELGLSQQAISQLEQKETIDKDLLEKVARALHVSPEAIKGFNEENAVNIISSNFSDHASVNSNCTLNFNPIDKWVEALEENKKLYERLLQAEREKNELLQKLVDEKK
jgi:transcriptional regulator with XRE-family HTH domain